MTLAPAKKRNGELTIPSLFSSLFDTDRFFGTGFPAMQALLPAVNIRETGNEFLIDVAAPGLDKNDFNISVDNQILTISAEKETTASREEESYTRKEYSYNSFSRSFQLPGDVKSEDIKAQYKEGVLKITLPKNEEAKKRSAKEIKVS